jgi:hypothetical protein
LWQVARKSARASSPKDEDDKKGHLILFMEIRSIAMGEENLLFLVRKFSSDINSLSFGFKRPYVPPPKTGSLGFKDAGDEMNVHIISLQTPT